MNDRMFAITTPEEVDLFLQQNPITAIFKAGTCHKTMQGWGNVERILRDRPQVSVGIIKVVEDRPASNHVAERTGIVHQSPQLILFRSGNPLFDLDNWNITLDALEAEFETHLSDVAVTPAETSKKSNLEPYRQLLDGYLAGAVSEPQFSFSYLNMLREDASLRAHEEFALLDSLFGNPDDHHIHAIQIMQHEAQNPQVESLLERATSLREKLNQL